MKTNLALFFVLMISNGLLAAPQKKDPVSASCKEITKVCQDAGFVAGGWKEGTGLWAHCINPVMRGVKEVKGLKKPMPKVSASLIAKCKKDMPEFGMAKK